jgi:hypothetical protein
MGKGGDARVGREVYERRDRGGGKEERCMRGGIGSGGGK